MFDLLWKGNRPITALKLDTSEENRISIRIPFADSRKASNDSHFSQLS